MARALRHGSHVTHLFHSVGLTHRALDYHLERHNVLASNIANVDTPGFAPQELVRDDAPDATPLTLRMETTHDGHVGSHHTTQGPFRLTDSQERVVNPGNDDNSVSLEREMSKVAANQLRYEGAIRIVRQQLGQLRYAANGGQG